MWKAFKMTAVICGLLIVHVSQAHAAWQLMFANDSFPITATWVGAHGGLYPCRVYFEGGIHPGWTARGKNACAFGWGGVEQDSSEYELWVEDWQPATNGNVPANAIPFGWEASGGSAPRMRYACQAISPAGNLTSGKVAPDIGGCDYAWGGVEQHATSYTVLVDSALSMVDVNGGSKLSVNPANTGFSGFTSTYIVYQSDGSSYADGTLESGINDNGDWLLFCGGYYVDGYHPGKDNQSLAGCVITYGGREFDDDQPFYSATQNWQINGNQNYQGGQLPIDSPIPYNYSQYAHGLFQSAVIGGQEANGSHLYICAGYTGNIPGWSVAYTPGKVSPALGGCSVAINGKEVIVPQYEVLAETYTKPSPY